MSQTWSEDRVVAIIKSTLHDIIAEGARNLADDGAWLPPCSAQTTRVVSCDAFQEGNDFRIDLGSVQSAGHRAVVQNLSDLAAMGAKPLGFLWSLEVPPNWLDGDTKFLRAFCDGAVQVCKTKGLEFYGGDLSLSRHRFSCTITIFGDAQGTPLSRQGALEGDLLYLSKPVGASAAGLAHLLKGASEQEAREIVDEHLWPSDECELGQRLIGVASACVDVSDGLSRDLHRLCRASGVGAVIGGLDEGIHPSIRHLHDARELALFGGEDYALLFTVPAGKILPDPLLLKEGVMCIGRITKGPGVRVRQGGDLVELPERGYDHFSSLS